MIGLHRQSCPKCLICHVSQDDRGFVSVNSLLPNAGTPQTQCEDKQRQWEAISVSGGIQPRTINSGPNEDRRQFIICHLLTKVTSCYARKRRWLVVQYDNKVGFNTIKLVTSRGLLTAYESSVVLQSHWGKQWLETGAQSRYCKIVASEDWEQLLW